MWNVKSEIFKWLDSTSDFFSRKDIPSKFDKPYNLYGLKNIYINIGNAKC